MRKLMALLVATIMMASNIAPAFAAVDDHTYNYDNLAGDKAKIINEKTPVSIARLENGQTAENLTKNPNQPAIYTLRTDYKAEKGEKYSVNYQPYVASVGEAASPDEQKKINKEIKLPNMAGYDKPKGVESFTNTYDSIVKKANNGKQTGNDRNGKEYLALNDYKYKARTNTVTVKHVFQDMEDFNKFTNKDGTITKYDGTVIDKAGKETKYDLKDPDQKAKYQELVLNHENLSTLKGNTGSTLEVQALPENERPGFEPQIIKLKTQVPEDTSDFKIEYRYNRAAYDVVFDTQDGTPLPTRTYYYDQEIPNIDENSIPTKEGCEFLGWKPSHNLKGADGKEYKKGEIIKDANGNAIVDLASTYYKKDSGGAYELEDGKPKKEKTEEIKLKMPALKLGSDTIPREKLTFTAVWKDKEKADYAIQFWAEKADHAANASILEKYDYMSTRVYKQKDTGSRPNLDSESSGPVDDGQGTTLPGLPFPDLDKARLQKIWKGAKFNRSHDLYLNKFFVYNKELTDKQNKDSKNPLVTKAVSATGKTVYNIYYDRQVYDLYFTKSNAQPEENTIYPEIWGYDPAKGEAVMLGGPGNLYHYKARFNEMMYKWPNDAKQTKGFTPGYQSFGWGPNYTSPNWPIHLDTPPYRLNAEEFLDMANYTSWGGYTKHIDKGDGTTIDLDPLDFTTLSFGIKQDHPSIPHHMDFWMDGFKKDETIIRYDLVRTKADTAGLGYGHRYPKVTGFTPRDYEPGNPQSAWPVIKEGSEENGRVNEEGIDELNDERDEITPNTCGTYYNNNGIKLPIGQLDFIPSFFSDTDEFGDVKAGGQEFTENGYLQFHYKRNKYPLRFNYDPTVIKADNEFKYPVKGGTEDQNKDANALETFYEFPLKALSPDVDDKDEYKKVDTKEGPKNLLDNPNNLFKLGLYDLLQRDKNDPKEFAKDKNGNYRVKRPEGLSDQIVFKGWALDPAGKKMVWKNQKETMPFHALNLYAIWNEPDYKWKVTVDPNGGKLETINPDKLTTEMKTIKEGDIGQEEEKTYPVKGYNGETAEPGKQVFTVVQRQKLKELPKPSRYGYDFLGWEVIRYKKDNNGDYTNEIDDSYRNIYKVPELYSFGTDVVAPIYLKAIWVENKRAEVKVYHYYLKKTDDGDKFVLDESKYPNPEENSLDYKRVGDYVPTTGEKQDEHWILADNDELMKKLDGKWVEQIKNEDGDVTGTKEHELKPEYEKYNERVKLKNTFFQTFRVLDNINVGTKENPVYKPNPENVFRFYYRPFRTRNYKVNFLDEKAKAEVEQFFKDLHPTKTEGLKDDALLEANKENKKKFEANRDKLEKILDKYKIVKKESVVSKCRHYDAKNYRQIPGWKLVGKPQQQLFYDVNEDTNEFLGINGTGSDEIYFYYKDVRVIEVKNPKDPTPEGYVRVTFKVDEKDKGGVFKDADGRSVTELNYDVIKGLKSDLLPHPILWEGGQDAQGNDKVKEANRYYITPDTGKAFKEWNDEKWLNKETTINRNYTFTAYFEWSGLIASGIVRTEAFKDPNNKWTNDFAPKIEDIKKQLVWKEKGQVKDLPAGTKIEFVTKDKEGNVDKVINSDEDIFKLVKEMNVSDTDKTIRIERIWAKVKFKDGGEKEQELPIPITVYKNRYEALIENDDKPEYLKDAEKKEAKEGGLKDILKDTKYKRYIKVTVEPTKKFQNKNKKVYYVNPNAWVDIPEIKITDDEKTENGFIRWSSYEDKKDNPQQIEADYKFNNRYKFTEDTIIKPIFVEDVEEQKDPNKKPEVPDEYVKVIVKTTDNATDDTKFEKTFWVNPKKEVTIPVTNPTGKTVAADPTKPGAAGYTMNFSKWEVEGNKDRNWSDKIVGQFKEKETTILAKYSVKPELVKEIMPTTDNIHTPQGKSPSVEEITKQITPPKGKTIKEVKIVKEPDVTKPGESKVKVIVEYTDGSSVGTKDKPLEITVKVHEPIIPANTDGSRPKEALENYVKVIFKAGTGGSVSGNLVYYVSPEVEVDMTESASKVTKTPDTGYYVNGEKWTNKYNKTLKGTFTDKETEFKFNFDKSKDIVEKIDENTKIPDGYVEVIFRADENGSKGKLEGGKVEKVYYVNPKADIKLKVLGDGEKAGEKELAVPKTSPDANYEDDGWYEPIDEINPIKDQRIHVARFKLVKVKLTYDGNGASKGNPPAEAKYDYGTKLRLASQASLEKDNEVFAGWMIDGQPHKVGDEISLTKDTTAIAQWTSVKHTVTFNTMGGSNVPSQEVVHGKQANKPDNPTLDGKVFMGWKEENKEEYFDFDTKITANKTLIAQWQKLVQKIDKNATVEEQFIKVTFKQGDHGKLVDDKNNEFEETTYKVAKTLTFGEAQQKGMEVPGIKPNKYYKAKADQEGEKPKYGWDKALDLTLEEGKTEKIFTALYEPEADVIPIDPEVTPDDKLQDDKPEGMVLVEFRVPKDKAYMDGTSKFYVKSKTEVKIKPPLLVKTVESYDFAGWGEDKKTGTVTGEFEKDTTIDSESFIAPDITVREPFAGDYYVEITNLTDGAEGCLVLQRNGQEFIYKPGILEIKTRIRRNKFKIERIPSFKLNDGDNPTILQSGDKIAVYAKTNGLKSQKRHYVVR